MKVVAATTTYHHLIAGSGIVVNTYIIVGILIDAIYIDIMCYFSCMLFIGYEIELSLPSSFNTFKTFQVLILLKLLYF